MISAFPVVITLSIIKGNRISDDLVFIIGSIFVGIGISILIIGFIVFLILLFLYVDTNMKPEMGELTFQRGSIQDDIKLLQSRSLKREDFIKPSNTFRRMSVIFEVNDSNSNIPKLNDATSLEFEITNSNRLDTS